MDQPSAKVEQVWRTSRVTRALCWVGLAAFGVGAVVLLVLAAWPTDGVDRVGFLVFGLGLAGFAAYAWRGGLRTRIEARPFGLVVINPIRTYIVPWDAVVQVEPGYSGLLIIGGGRSVTAWAVQQANISEWLGRRSRSVRVAEEILAAARLHRPEGA